MNNQAVIPNESTYDAPTFELLLDGFERSKTGRGQAFSIMSEAGVGKSRLLYEFRKTVAREDVTFLEGRCHPLGQALLASCKVYKRPYLLQLTSLSSHLKSRIGNIRLNLQISLQVFSQVSLRETP